MSSEPRNQIQLPSQAVKSQAAAIESSRAVAEVQAAVVVAQQVPRDTLRATAAIRDLCGNEAFAKRAAYAVPNRGQGPSVHLARELAREWGNVQYGVHELNRDDAAGVSEVIAFAWDVQANVRSTRTFIVPHAKSLKGGKRQKLDDLNDIYLNNQNVGARAARECIFTILPDWLIQEATAICAQTLKHGGGEPLHERVAKMIGGFRTVKVTAAMLEERLGKQASQWDESDIADLTVLARSIQDREVTVAEEFPPKERPVTSDELTRRPAPPSDDSGVNLETGEDTSWVATGK